MYRVTYEQGNGYHCGCCRITQTESIDFDTPEEVTAWLSELAACQTESVYEDDDDRDVLEIREIKDEDLTEQFQADPYQVADIINARKEKKAEKKATKEAEALERKKQKLAELKKELGEE